MYITSGLERVVRNGDTFIFEGGLKCSVVDVLETHFTVWAKEEGMIYKNATVFIPEKHDKIPILQDDDVKELESINKQHRVDFVMIPYLMSVDDIKETKKWLSFLDKAVIVGRIDD